MPECAICQERTTTVDFPCGHAACEDCILLWFARYRTCHLCRAPVPTAEGSDRVNSLLATPAVKTDSLRLLSFLRTVRLFGRAGQESLEEVHFFVRGVMDGEDYRRNIRFGTERERVLYQLVTGRDPTSEPGDREEEKGWRSRFISNLLS